MKKEKIDRHLLMKAREAALYKVKNTMPAHNELPDEHVARCWMESFIDVGLVDPAGYNDRIQYIKEISLDKAIACSNDITNASEKLGLSCPSMARNPGLFFGYMMAVKEIIKILEEK